MTRLFSVYGDSISSFEGILPQGWRVFFEGKQLELTGVKTPHDTWWGQVIDHFDGSSWPTRPGRVAWWRDATSPSAPRPSASSTCRPTGVPPMTSSCISASTTTAGARGTRRSARQRLPLRRSLRPSARTMARWRAWPPKEPLPTSRNPTAECWQRCTPNTRTPASGSPRSFPAA